MQAQLEIGSVSRRLNGKFAKPYLPVLVMGQVIGKLSQHDGATWLLTCLPGDTLFEPKLFSCRDDACSWLFDRYTSEPATGPFSLSAWRKIQIMGSYDPAYNCNQEWDDLDCTDADFDTQYAETDDSLMRADSLAYNDWLDTLNQGVA